jgi:transposase
VYDRRIHRVRDLDSGGARIFLDFEYRRVPCPVCGVRREQLEWLSDSRRFTRRLARETGRQCRELSEARVAAMPPLSWAQVRRLDQAYLEELLAKHPPAQRLRAIQRRAFGIKDQRYLMLKVLTSFISDP